MWLIMRVMTDACIVRNPSHEKPQLKGQEQSLKETVQFTIVGICTPSYNIKCKSRICWNSSIIKKATNWKFSAAMSESDKTVVKKTAKTLLCPYHIDTYKILTFYYFN